MQKTEVELNKYAENQEIRDEIYALNPMSYLILPAINNKDIQGITISSGKGMSLLDI